MGPLLRLLREARASLHRTCGRLAYRAGMHQRARRHFEKVLVLRGSDFQAYVHLGLIAYTLGDYAGWRREFEHARRTDPDQFAKLRHPFEWFEPRLAGTDFDDTSARATWRAPWAASPPANPRRLLPGGGQPGTAAPGAGPEPTEPDRIAPPAAAGLPSAQPPRPPHGDDFSSGDERRRFAELQPIRATDVKGCDVEELARRLSG